MRIVLFALLTLTSLLSNARQPSMAPTNEAIRRLETDIPVLLEKSDVPGMSIALIRDGRLVWSKGFGVSNVVTKKPVTTNTIFEAASLSKPVFAYAVLRLVDEGKLNLDTPLNKYLGNNYDVVGDDRINLITARRVLWRRSPECGSKRLCKNMRCSRWG
jgi:CubicO group peptidase (beta-lactamase class C family)